jgi:hypothetical protein
MSKPPGSPRLRSTGRASCRRLKTRSGPLAVNQVEVGHAAPEQRVPLAEVVVDVQTDILAANRAPLRKEPISDHVDRAPRLSVNADRLRASPGGPGWRAARQWRRRPPPTPTRPPIQPSRTSPGDHHRMLGHSHTPAGITPVAGSASHPSAPSARNCTTSPTNRSTSPRDPYVGTRLVPASCCLFLKRATKVSC